jgi:hypothetical protein
MFFVVKNLCANIEYPDLHSKFIFTIFWHTKLIFLYIFHNKFIYTWEPKHLLRKPFYYCEALYVCYPLLISDTTIENQYYFSTVSLLKHLLLKCENVGSVKFKTIEQVVLLITRDNAYGATLQGKGKDSFYSRSGCDRVIVISILGKKPLDQPRRPRSRRSWIPC